MEVANRLAKRHDIHFLCQSSMEHKTIKRLFPGFAANHPKNPREYAEVISSAKAALVSRIHCAIPMAGMGIPSLVIGTDTRTWTVNEAGLNSHYVKEVDSTLIIDAMENLASSNNARSRLKAIAQSTLNSYINIVKSLI